MQGKERIVIAARDPSGRSAALCPAAGPVAGRAGRPACWRRRGTQAGAKRIWAALAPRPPARMGAARAAAAASWNAAAAAASWNAARRARSAGWCRPWAEAAIGRPGWKALGVVYADEALPTERNRMAAYARAAKYERDRAVEHKRAGAAERRAAAHKRAAAAAWARSRVPGAPAQAAATAEAERAAAGAERAAAAHMRAAAEASAMAAAAHALRSTSDEIVFGTWVSTRGSPVWAVDHFGPRRGSDRAEWQRLWDARTVRAARRMDAEQRERMGAAEAAKYGKEEWDRMGEWIDGRRLAYERASDRAAGRAAQAAAESEGRLWQGIIARARDGWLALPSAGAKGWDAEAALAARMRAAKRAHRASDGWAAALARGFLWHWKTSQPCAGWHALKAAEAEGRAVAAALAARMRAAKRAHRASDGWAAADARASAAREVVGPARGGHAGGGGDGDGLPASAGPAPRRPPRRAGPPAADAKAPAPATAARRQRRYGMEACRRPALRDACGLPALAWMSRCGAPSPPPPACSPPAEARCRHRTHAVAPPPSARRLPHGDAGRCSGPPGLSRPWADGLRDRPRHVVEGAGRDPGQSCKARPAGQGRLAACIASAPCAGSKKKSGRGHAPAPACPPRRRQAAACGRPRGYGNGSDFSRFSSIPKACLRA